ncbi:MAG: caspase family protein [Saprospiraceae bacterium]|nr:caspase family protein [Saprospiraceae bacterium]
MNNRILYAVGIFILWITSNSLCFSRTKALVIGISHYQDPEIPDLQLPHRDAEIFAGYLRSGNGMKLKSEDLYLLTNAYATAGQVILALDRLFDEVGVGDTLVIYFSGYGYLTKSSSSPPQQIYFYDTPLQIRDAGSFDLFGKFIEMASELKNLPLLVYECCSHPFS